jgi:hypothetical protein
MKSFIDDQAEFKKHTCTYNIVEICYRRTNDEIAVHYRREAGTDEANDLIAQVEEHQALLGEAARYFYRTV